MNKVSAHYRQMAEEPQPKEVERRASRRPAEISANGLQQSPAFALPSFLSKKDMARFRRALLRWYDRNRRDLPWRNTRDPYRIWLSEIMLQQTRVAAVLEHYRIFLERFPDVEALAAASEDDVLAAWSGLGYYRRARMLHRCARQLVAEHNGSFPRNSAALLDLPGIGRYTAAAIASIAFAEPIAVVDGNVERVLQRFARTHLTLPQTWSAAQALLHAPRPGDHNQAMMELGATVCQPRAPRCPLCPVSTLCASDETVRATVMERRTPPPGVKPSSRQIRKTIWCVLAERNGAIRMVQLSRKARLMPGMWELPRSTQPTLLTASEHWRTFRHSITVTDYLVHVLRHLPTPSTRKNESAPKPFANIDKVVDVSVKQARARWIAISRIPNLPITGLTRKILKAAGVI